MNNRVISASHNITTIFSRRAVTEIWTQDLFLTKEVLYHWAITAALFIRAENGAQTRDPQLGRLVLYQLSYFRNTDSSSGSGWWWIRTTEVERQQIYSLPHLAALETTLNVLLFLSLGLCPVRASCRIRTNDPEITNHVLWPTELKRLTLSIR